MSAERRDDGLWRAVAALPVIAVDEARAARLRAHCRRTLERNPRPRRDRANVGNGANVGNRPSVGDRVSVGAATMLWTWSAWHTLWRIVSRQRQPGQRGFPVSGSARS